jgi:hypothetical protein
MQTMRANTRAATVEEAEICEYQAIHLRPVAMATNSVAVS